MSVETNRPLKGDNSWKGVGEVRNASRWEVKRGDGEFLGRSGELDDTGWGVAGDELKSHLFSVHFSD